MSVRKNKAWTEEEEDFICINFYKMSIDEISDILGRTKTAVKSKALHLGLRRNYMPKEKDGLFLCTKCQEYKEIDNFYKNKKSKTGLFHFCKPCASMHAKRKYHKERADLEDEHLRQAKQKFIDSKKGELFFCKLCQTEKPIDDYAVYRRTTRNDRYERRNYCRPCASKHGQERRIEKERKNEYAKFTTKS